MIQTSRVSARWLLGAGQLAFATSFRFGKSGEHEVRVLVSREELARRARDLRENAEEDARFEAKIPRGRGVQIVTIRVPRELLLSLANAIAGAVSDEDAGHRLWHREYPHQPRPCHDCQETIDARRRQADEAHAEFADRWALTLGADRLAIDRMLVQYRILLAALPRP